MRLRAPAFAVLAFALLAAACDSRSPTEGGGPPDENSILIDDPNGLLTAVAPALRAAVGSAIEASGRVLPVTGVTARVVASSAQAIPGYGFGGRAPGPGLIELYVDPTFPALAALIPERLPPMTAHEVHHAIRIRGPGYGRTLLEGLVSEGMADHFSIELLGVPVPPWSRALSESAIAHYMELARQQFDAPLDYNRWFVGEGGTLPNWTGYTLGFRLVEDYKARHPGSTAASLVNTPAEAFRPN
jgi:Predicted Zn-dependent protease (DUF2268)